jgi:hypothetical protein
MKWNDCNNGRNLPNDCRRVLVTDGENVYEANLSIHGKWIHSAYNPKEDKILSWAEMPGYQHEGG